MAQRNNLNKMQKELNQLKNEQNKTNQLVREHDQALKDIQRREIVRMLSEKNSPNSPWFRYTYDEIARELNCSSSTVNNVAKEHGLSRRLKVVD